MERSPYVKYKASPKFPLVGHLGPIFKNEAMYINRPQDTFIMQRDYLGQFTEYRDLTAERSPYVKYGESPSSRWAAILD